MNWPRRNIALQIAVPIVVLAVALVLRAGATDALLGTALGAYLAYVVQQRTESRIHEAEFHTELVQHVLAPLYTEVHTNKEAFRRVKEEGEDVSFGISTVTSVASNWLYSRLGEHLLRSIDEYKESLKTMGDAFGKPRQIAYVLTNRAASETFQDPKNIQTVFCSRTPGTFRSVSVDLMLGHNPFAGMKEGSLVLGDGSITRTVQFAENKDLFNEFWKTAEDLASKDPDILNLRVLINEARNRTVDLDRKLDQEIERLRK